MGLMQMRGRWLHRKDWCQALQLVRSRVAVDCDCDSKVRRDNGRAKRNHNVLNHGFDQLTRITKRDNVLAHLLPNLFPLRSIGRCFQVEIFNSKMSSFGRTDDNRMTIKKLMQDMEQTGFIVTGQEDWENIVDTLQQFNKLKPEVRHNAILTLVLGDGRPRFELHGDDDATLTYSHAMKILRLLEQSAPDVDPISLVKDLWSYEPGRQFADRFVAPDAEDEDDVDLE